jgi:hypothetical protein
MFYKEKQLLFLLFFSICTDDSDERIKKIIDSNNRNMLNGGVILLKKVERVLIKIVIIQFIFLFLTQLFFHQMDVFPQIKQLTKYEGVNENKYTEILQTFQGK